MQEILYTVIKITGDYAILIDENGVENTVAMAFLPIEIIEGNKVLYKDFSYSLI